MENFIVRIYRRDSVDPWKIAGMVENVVKGENTSFKSAEELMKILKTPSKAADCKFRLEGKHGQTR